MEIIGEWDARFNREVWEKYGHEKFLRIFMPIKMRERVIGVVEVGYDKRTKGHIGEEEVQMLAAFMDQAAVALENARLFEQTQTALAETETLYAGSERLTRAVTMDDVLQALVQSTTLQRIERVNLLLFDSPLLPDEQPDAFTVAAVWERDGEAPGGYAPVTAGTPPAGTRYEFDQFPAARIITRHEPTAVNDVAEDARFDEISRDLFLKQLGMRSVIFWPLMIGRQWIGVLSGQARTPLRLREDETRQIGSLIDQAAVVLQNIRLLEETQRRATSLAAAAAVARDATAILDVDRLLEQTVQLISEQFGFYHAGVFLLDERDEYAILQAASSEGGRHMLKQGHKLRIGGGGIVGHVAQTGEPRIALDVGEDSIQDQDETAQGWDRSAPLAHTDLPNTRSEMALPLKVQDRVIGVLDVQSTTEAAFSDDHVAVLQTLADQLATAIANARLFEQVQRRARRERLIREITARVRSTVDVESILQTTVQELGKALGTSYGVVRLGTEAELAPPPTHGRAGSGSGERETEDGS
jgi:GAF domain-containing protein